MKKIKIVGCGISGSVLANILANNGWDVDIYDKNDFVGGNCYDFINSDGILIHKFGPHIFHTNDEEVKNFINKYTKLNSYQNKVLVRIKDLAFPLPINFNSIRTVLNNSEISDEIIEKLKKCFPNKKTITLFEMNQIKDYEIVKLAKWLYDNVYSNYTAKMWGKTIEQIDPDTINRVKIVLGYEHNYFPDDKYQGLPLNGYTAMIKNILNHPNIKVHLKTNALEHLKFKEKILWDDNECGETIVYCGPLDEALDYKYGMLPYRSLEIKFETHNVSSYQEAPIINYPADPIMTRIVDYKQMTLQNNVNKSTISKEYPGQFDLSSKRFNTRFYPIVNHENMNLYDKYLSYFRKYKNFYPLGRLAQYKYFDMDDAIKQAMFLAKELLHA